MATEIVAWRLRFHPHLGPVTLVSARVALAWRLAAAALAGAAVLLLAWRRTRSWSVLILVMAVGAWCVSLGAVYKPQRILVWMYAYRHVSDLQAVLHIGVSVFAGMLVAAVVGALIAVPSARRAVSGSHGTAMWGEPWELVRVDGVLLGRAPGRGGRGALLRENGDGHLLSLAPSRAGKGIGVVVPNLLSYPGSIVVTDPKGENYAVSAQWREETFDQDVVGLDPFGLADGTGAYNPLDIIDLSTPDAYDDAAMLADMLIVTEGRGNESVFWTLEARALLTGLILHVAASEQGPTRTLAKVRAHLTAGPESFAALMQVMATSTAAWGLVATEAQRVLQKDATQLAGVLASAQSQTHFLGSPRMASVMQRSSFTWESLKTERVTVYVIVPPDRLPTYRRWVRLMLACALRGVTREPGRPDVPALFLLDEFAQLGRMAPVETAVRLAAGYGVRLWLFVQDLASLRELYPDSWETFVANAGVFQAFGVNDKQTAEYLSALTGEGTIRVVSDSRSSGVTRGRSGGSQHGSGETYSERGRRLLTPDEVRRLGRGEQLLFLRYRPPYRVRLLDYRVEPELAGRAGVNPMYANVGA
ncbi:MAG TPA: type IV secretory system conjugative DNA transfer family protein [Gemmatimonadaceae bacterium]|nr:type IV secretory system conjugative DNA transfer family protein [Gemmatimonadaceae bacterium]